MVKLTSARWWFAAALLLFGAWVAALATLAVISSARPPESARRPAQSAGANTPSPEQPITE